MVVLCASNGREQAEDDEFPMRLSDFVLPTVNNVELVDSCKDGFVSFGLDCDTKWDTKVIVDVKEMREATSRVMKRNQIPADRSEDLRKK